MNTFGKCAEAQELTRETSSRTNGTKGILKKALSCFLSVLLCTSLTPVSPFNPTIAVADPSPSSDSQTLDNEATDPSADSSASEDSQDSTQDDSSDEPASDEQADTSDQAPVSEDDQDANSPAAQSDDSPAPMSDEPAEDEPSAQSEEDGLPDTMVYKDDNFDPDVVGSVFAAEQGYWYDITEDKYIFDASQLDPDSYDMGFYDEYTYKLVFQVTGPNEASIGITNGVGGVASAGDGRTESAYGRTISGSSNLYDLVDYDNNLYDIPAQIQIPASVNVDGNVFNITSVANNAFSGASVSVESIGLPEGLTTIGSSESPGDIVSGSAFYGNYILTSVSLPSTLTTIHNASFSGCEALTEITIPASVKTLGTGTTAAQSVFNGCDALTKVTIEGDESNPSQLENIGDYLFRNLFITDASIGYGVKATGVNMFYQCDRLVNITLADSIETLSEGTFRGCTALKKLVLPDSLKVIGKEAFRENTGIVGIGDDPSRTKLSLVIPTSVETIGEGAFRGCTELTELYFQDPASALTTIDDRAFYGCTKLKTAGFPPNLKVLGSTTEVSDISECSDVFYNTILDAVHLPNTIEVIGAGAFRNATTLTTFRFGNDTSGITAINPYTFYGCKSLKYVCYGGLDERYQGRMPESITSIGDYAFANCSALLQMNLHEGITTLGTTVGEGADGGSQVFSGCTSLSSVEIPSTIENYGSNIFVGNTVLSSVTFAEGTKSTAPYMFNNCVSLASITLPASLGTEGGTIGTSLFYNCRSLEEVIFEEGYSVAGDYMFNGCTALQNIDLPSTLTTAGSHMFNGCNSISHIELPPAITDGAYMLAGCTTLTSISFAENCTSISDYMLAGLSLTSIELPDTLTTLGAYAFKDCANISSITLPASLTTVGERIFDGCTNLNNVIFAEGFQVIGAYMFEGFTEMKGITLPDTLTELGDYAFKDCTGLTSIKLPASLEVMGENVFQGCTNLTNIEFAEGFKVIGARMFEGFTNLESITLPDTLETLGDYAFKDCTNLKSILLPASLVNMGENVFQGCTSLTNIEFAPGFKVIGARMFEGFTNIETITLPETLETLSDYAFKDCTNLKSVTLPASLVNVGEHVFEGCSSLATVEFGEGYSVVGDYMFTNLEGLVNISLPDTLTEIGAYAFQNCTFVENVDLSNVQKIGEGAFEGCSKITQINLKSVQEIGANAFSGTNITHLTMPDTVIEGMTIASFADCAKLVYVNLGGIVSIDDEMFKDCTLLETVEMPNVTGIGNSTFAGCTSLESIDLSKVTSIGNNAFDGCSALVNVTLGSLSSIGDSAFANCSSIAALDLSGVKTIGNGAFSNCSSLANIDLSDVESIGDSAFSGCAALTAIDLASAHSIGASAFEATAITSLSIGSGLETIGNRAFANCSSLTSVDLPEGINVTSTHVFYGCENLETVNFVEGAQTAGFDPIAMIASVFSGSDSSNLASLGANMFENCAKLANIDLTKVGSIGAECFKGCTLLTSVDLTNATYVASDAFTGSKLTSLIMPSTPDVIDFSTFTERANLEYIDMGAATTMTAGMFLDCTKLKTLIMDNVQEIPDFAFCDIETYRMQGELETLSIKSAKKIGASALLFCMALKNLDLSSVEEVGLQAFYYCSALETVDLPSVKNIGSGAFGECASLADVSIGDGATIEMSAFNGLSALKNVTIGSDANIGDAAFGRCAGLTDLEIGDGSTIGSQVFSGCTSLVNVSLGDGSTIGDQAFSGCAALANVSLGNGLSIGQSAFDGCTAITDIDLSGVATIGSLAFNGCANIAKADLTSATSIANDAFKGASITSLVMPSTPNVIDFSAFDGRDKIVSIDMGAATQIGANQFVGCTNLEDVVLRNVASIGDSAFEGCAAIKAIDLGIVESVGDNAFARTGLESIELPTTFGANGAQIGSSIFEGCTSLSDVTINADLDGLTDSMFKGCTALVSVDLANVATSIGNSAFEGCTSLEEVPNCTVTHIGDRVFYGCTNFKGFDLSKVQTIGESAFSGCSSIEEVNIDAATSIRENAFAGTSIKRLTLPSTPAVIVFSAFENCAALEYVDLGGATTVSDGMFTKCTNLQEVHLNNVTHIGDNAFDGCTKLATVDFSNVKVIGDLAFNGCALLSQIDLSNVEQIGDQAFRGCTSLGDIDLSSATTLGSNAFTSTSITSVVLSSDLSSVGPSVFSGCTSLESAVLPEGMTQTGLNMFYGCTSLTSVQVPASLGQDGSTMGDGMFMGCVNITDVQLGTDENPLKIVGAHMFDGCDGLTTIDLSNVESIGDSAFARCNNLNVVDLSQVSYVGPNAFDGANVVKLTLPGDTSVIDFDAFAGCDNLEYVDLGGATQIADNLFANCPKLSQIELRNVTSIGAGAFKGCSDLEEIDLSKITSIGDNAFEGCNSLTSVQIPSTVTTIGDSVFANCEGLTEAVLGTEDAPLTSVASNMFNGCTSLVTVDMVSVETIEAGAFNGCDKLEEVNLTNATSVERSAFAGTKIKRLYLPRSLKTLSDSTFEDCDYLVYVNLGGVTDIGASAFVGCSSLETVVFNDVENIGNNAFEGCEKLSAVNCDNVMTIGDSAFKGCIGLESINIENASSLGTDAFNGCTSIKTVDFSSDLASVSDGAFAGCTSLRDIAVPAATSVGTGAFSGCTSLIRADIPSLTTVGDSAFEGCTKLASIPQTFLKTIGSKAFKDTAVANLSLASIESLGDSAFEGSKLTVIRITSMPQTVGDSVFANCASLTDVSLPEGIEIESAGMFMDCAALVSVDFSPIGASTGALASLGPNMFKGCSSLSSIDLSKVKKAMDGALEGCSSIQSADLSNFEELNVAAFPGTAFATLKLPLSGLEVLDGEHMANFATVTTIDFGGVTSINPGALDVLTGLENATLNKVTSLDEGVFTNNASLTNVSTGLLQTIGDRAFQNCSAITSIDIENVTSIGEGAFSGCSALTFADIASATQIGDSAFASSGLESLTIGSVLQSVGSGAFANCAALATLEVQDGAILAGDSMFSGCSTLSEIDLAPGATISGNSVFEGCSSIGTLVIPENTTISGDSVFVGCSSLANLTIESGATISGGDAFNGCSAINALNLSDGITLTGSNMFKGCTGLVNVEIPSTITELPEGMFQECSGLSTVKLPSITKVAADGFKDCSELVTVDGNSLREIGNGAFENCTKLRNLSTANTAILGDAAFRNTTSLLEVTLTNAESIGESAFEGSGVEHVIIGEGLKQAGDAIFSGCLNLVDLVLEANATFSSNATFKGCPKLGSVTFNPGVKIYGNEVFRDCEALATVNVATENIVIEGDYVFSGCTSLTNVQLPKSLLVGVGTFMDCSNLKSVDVIPKNDETYTFAARMFENCEKLNNIDLGMVTSIGDSAFKGCTSLAAINLQKATAIGDEAFKDCVAITRANAIDIETLGNGAFEGTSLQELILSPKIKEIGPDTVKGTAATLAVVNLGGVTDIADATFQGFDKLTSVNMGSAVNVGENAFYGCSSLASANMSKVEVLGDGAFENCVLLEEADLSSLKALNPSAFVNTFVKTLKLPTEGIGTLDASMLDVFKSIVTVDVGGATTIAGAAFADCPDLTSVKLNNVDRIENGVFNGCAKLANISFGNVTVIGDEAFKGCEALVSLDELDGATTLGENAFAGCISLSALDLPSTIESVGANAFDGCSALASLTFEDGYSVAGENMFKDCTSLTSVVLPGTLENPGKYMFQGCTNLSEVVLGSEEAPLVNISESMFDSCTSLETIDLSRVVKIGDYAFLGCRSLKDADLSSATEIGRGALSNTAVITLKLSNDLKRLPKTALEGCTTPQKIDFGGVEMIEESSFTNYVNLREIVIGSVQSIGNMAFRGCVSLNNISFPDGCAIGDQAFSSCRGISNIDLSNVSSIGANAFQDCTAIPAANITSATSIGDAAFVGCSVLSSASIDAATSIGASAFKNCTALKSLTIGAAESIGDNAFSGTSISEVTLPSTLGANDSAVGTDIFRSCASLGTVTVADGLTSIFDGMFRDCAKLSQINLGQVENVGADAFNGCVLLTDLDFAGAKQVEDGAFAGTSITSAVLPSIEAIGSGVFADCGELQVADISNISTADFSLGESIFDGCSNLEKITLPSVLTQIGDNAFNGAAKLSVIELKGVSPTNETSIPSNGFEAAGATNLEKLVFYGTRLNPQGQSDSVEGSQLFGDGSLKTYVTLYFYDSLDSLSADEEAATYENASGYLCLPYDIKLSLVAYNVNMDDVYDSYNYYGSDSCILDYNMDSVFVSAASEPVSTQRQKADDTLRCHFFDCDVLVPTIKLAEGPYTYTGSEVEPLEDVTVGKFSLSSDQYKVEYENNIDAGEAKVTVSLMISGVSYGTAEETFQIEPADIQDVQIADVENQSYISDPITPEPELTFNDKVLELGTDYTISYDNNVNVGMADMTFTGQGNFTGTATSSFEIVHGIISQGKVDKPDDVVYKGTAHEPELTVTMFDGTPYEKTLVSGTDYTVEYSNNVDVGTATAVIKGAGGYTGELSTTFEIVQKDISDVEISDIDDQVYTGSYIEPEFTLTDGDSGVELVRDSDYAVEFTRNIMCAKNIGKAAPTITITGKGNYKGEVSVKFSIVARSVEEASIEGLQDVIYSGSAFTPTPVVRLDVDPDVEPILEERSHYLLSYENNTDAGTATVIITGVGNYTGEARATFNIEPKSLDDADLSSIEQQIYTGEDIEPAFTVAIGNKTLVSGTDFDYAYSDNRNVGTAKISIEGKGNYTGSREIEFDILHRGIEGADVSGYEDVTYTGSAFAPTLEVAFNKGEEGEKVLQEGTDFKVTYSDNTNVGEATILVEGIGGYDGSQELHFQIGQKSVLDSSVEVIMIDNYIYTGKEINPEGRLNDKDRDNKVLVRGSDYTVEYENNIDAAEIDSENPPAVIVRGIGNYGGVRTINFTIQPARIGTAQISPIPDVTYSKEAFEPVPTVKINSGTDEEAALVQGTDYTVEYSNNVNAGTATVSIHGMGNYTGISQETFTISPKDISEVAISKVDDQTYTGDAISPEIVVSDGETALQEGMDYQIECENNTAVGEAVVTVKGNGNYTGSQTLKFNINSRTIEDAEVAGAPDVIYNGQAYTPEVVVTLGNKKLVKDVDYTLSFSNNVAAGTATVTVSGVGGYSGQTTSTFKIEPRSINDVKIANIESETFNGQAIEPVIAITDPLTEEPLVRDTDFTVTYANNINAATITSVAAPKAIIVGTGNYGGTRSVNFTISPMSIESAQVTGIDDDVYDGTDKAPEPTVTLNADSENPVVLEKDNDYVVEYTNNRNAGTAGATVKGIGNYTGSIDEQFVIDRRDIDVATIDEIAEQTYTGERITPSLAVSDGETALAEGTDYSVSYDDNVSVGEATATISGMGNYQGTKAAKFQIARRSVASAQILGVSDATYNGSAHTPEPVVVLAGKVLVKDNDYTVSYENNTDAGKAKVIVSGANGYSDSASVEFTISPKNISDGDVSVASVSSATFTGEAIEPALDITDSTRHASLVKDTDYSVEFANNVNAAAITSANPPSATITGKGNYTGTRSITFAIEAMSIDGATVSGLENVIYTGSAFEPVPTVAIGETELVKDVDYSVSYENNIAAGTASVKIEGKGNYTGVKDANFDIQRKDISAMPIAAIPDQSYTGAQIKPGVTVTDGKKALEEGTDYTVSYSSNTEVSDTPVVTVEGIGNYSGTITSTFNIVAKDIAADSVDVQIAGGNVYTGAELAPAVTVTDVISGTAQTLIQDVDYKLTYTNNKNAGNSESFNPPAVTIQGIGNYKGVQKCAFTIDAKAIDDITIDAISDQVYSGGDTVEPKLVVKDGETTLKLDRDYEVEYSNNVNAGTAEVKVVGIGNYSGQQQTTFNIVQKNISMAIMAAFDPQTFNGAPIEPEITLIDGNRMLEKGVDFDIEFSENTNAGTASVTITGTGNYNGSKVVRFLISAKSLAGVEISDIPAETYDGNAHTPHPVVTLDEVTLQEGRDYAVSYSDNVNCGTAAITITGAGNYSGMASSTFEIEHRSIDDAVVDEIANEVYRQDSDHKSVAHEPTPAVSIGERRLIKDLEYTLAYENNADAGTATVTITGIGNYTGEITRNFEIAKRDLSDAFITPLADQTLVIGGNTPSPTVTVDGVMITRDIDYTIDYANNDDVGEATLTVKGIGNYTGQKSMNFKIVAHPFTYETIVEVPNQVYDGTFLEPAPTVRIGTKILEPGVEYVTSYDNNQNAGNATITITGIGNYSGTVTKNFAITARPLSDESLHPNEGINIVTIEDQVYAGGNQLRPEISILDRGTKLKLDQDYVATYANNEDVVRNETEGKTPTVTIMGIGNYQGELQMTFNIVQKPLSDNEVTLVINENSTYNGSAQTPSFTVKNGDITLTSDVDYTYEYANNVNASTVTAENPPALIVKGKGNYTGEKQTLFTIYQKSLSSAKIEGLTNQTYTGEPIIYNPTVTLPGATTDEDVLLEEGVDYELDYGGTNINAGDVTVKVKGIGNYTGEASATCKITQKLLAGFSVNVPDQTYTGAALTPDITVAKDGVTLVKDKDFVVRYSNNVNVGKATLAITGIGNYTGSLNTGSFTINPQSMSQCKATVAAQVYTGSALTPKPVVTCGGTTLVEGTDYTLGTYANNINVGTATIPIVGKGNYSGTINATFAISAKAVSTLTVTAPGTQDYTGSALTPKPIVTDGSKALTENTHYSLTYSNNINAGTATVTVTGKGNYTGTKSTTFAINAKSIATATVSPLAAVNYTGAAQMPAVSVVNGGVALMNGVDYTVTYANNVNAGTASVAITGKGNYSGSIGSVFVINKLNDSITGGTKSKSFKVKDLKKKKKTFKIAAKAKTTLKYKVKKYVKVGKITAAKAKKAVKIATTGTVTVAKKTAKGTYKVQVEVTAAGNTNYKSVKKTLTLQIKVK